MRITLNELRSFIADEVTGLLHEADSDGDGTSDKEELYGIAAAMEEEEEEGPRDYKHGSPEDPLYHPESSEEWVILIASDGEEIKLPSTLSGVETGFAVIANPAGYDDDHPFYSPHWKQKDGDTVIGVEEDYTGGPGETMSVADAYQELHRMWDKEHEGWAKDIEDERWEYEQEEITAANIAAAEAAAEERIMLTPEEGEEFPGQIGMGRGRMMEESFTRGDIKNFFARGLLTEDIT